MKKSRTVCTVLTFAVACLAFGTGATIAADVSTPVLPTQGYGLPISDPSGLIAYYKCSVTNLTQKAQTIFVQFVNDAGEVIPSARDGYNQQCSPPADSEQTLQPQETLVARCSIVEWYDEYLGLPEFFQDAVRCRVSEFTGNTANWMVSLCVATPYNVFPTPYYGEAGLCVQSP